MQAYKDPSKPVEERVEDLLSRMTLEEKAAQLCGDLPTGFLRDPAHMQENLRNNYPDGHGRFTQFSLLGLQDPAVIAGLANAIQRYFVEETRLGIPVVFQSENLCGYPGKGGTLFPAPINVGCTWDPELVQEMASVISRESRAVGITSAMSPVIDISRDPRWGRTSETYGEDPYLTSRMGVAFVRGMQKNKTDGVAAIAKHFLGYSESQGGLNLADCRIPDRELYEVFATPFEAAMREAGLSSVMANYGEIDGMCVAANPKIARNLLRDTMKFEGILTSDGAAVMKMATYYHTASSYEEAGLLAKKAGTDTEIPVGRAFRKLPDYVRSGELDEAVLDESVRRVLRVKFEYGLFEYPYIDPDRVPQMLANEETWKLAERAAKESIVLLKNDGVLPLKQGARLALVGPHADSLRYPVSGYTYPAYLEMMGVRMLGQNTGFNGLADEDARNRKETGAPAAPQEQENGSDIQRQIESAVQNVMRDMGARSLKKELEERFSVSFAKGCNVSDSDRSGFEEAVSAAKNSDAVVFACGGTSGWVQATGGEGVDRCRLDLPGVQQELLDGLLATGKPVILVLYGPGVFALPQDYERASAVVQAFLPGARAGRAVADVLDGTWNPEGKLTTTIPRSVGQIPVTYNHRTGSGYESLHVGQLEDLFTGGYVDESNRPLFCFGHGLSYTSFELSEFTVSADTVKTDGVLEIGCTVANSGMRTGAEVVQLYYHTKRTHVIRPVKQLAGFAKVTLAPGECRRIRFRLSMAQLGYYNENMDFVVEPTEMDIMIGTSAHDIAWTHEVAVRGETINVMGRRVYECEVFTE